MKRAVLLFLIVLAAFAAVSGTIAFFTDAADTRATVEGGNLGVIQHEYERTLNADGTYANSLRRFTQGQMMYPSVPAASLTRMDVTVGDHTVQMYDQSLANFVDKIVTAENTGSLLSYVRTFVAVPARYEGETAVDWLHLDFNTAGGWVLGEEPLRNQLIDGQRYDIYYVTCRTPLQPGATSAPSLLGFYLDKHVTAQGDRYQYLNGTVRTDLGTADELTILVATQASQAAVFEAEAYKSAADVALDSTFGAPQDGCHPWSPVHFAADQQTLDSLLATLPAGSRIGLRDGAYTLPAQLPGGTSIIAMGAHVSLSAPAFTGAYVSIDGVTFTSPVTFTGDGVFEDCTFTQGWHLSPVSGPIRVENCRYNDSTVGDGAYPVHLVDCLPLN